MNPTPRKLALLMALAGLGMSLPATVEATVGTRASPSRASLDEVFGFRAAETTRASAPPNSDEALARLIMLGLAGPPALARSGDLPVLEDASPPSKDGVSSSEAAAAALAVPALVVESQPEVEAEDTADAPAAALASATAAPGAHASVADATADAMANALALVAIAEESAPAHLPAPSSAEVPAFVRGPTAGRPPRTGADTLIEHPAQPVATDFPDFDFDPGRIDALPARDETKQPSHAAGPALDIDLDPWADAMQEPFEAEATVVQAADAPAAITVMQAADVPAAITSVDIDLSGIGIGTEPDIDLGRALGDDPSPRADIALDLPLPAPATAAAPHEASPVLSKQAGVLGVALAEAVSEDRLDRVRGGFSSTDGLQVSFGIERAVYVNGALVTTTSLNVSGLGNTTGGPPSATASAGQMALVQNGAGNTFLTGSMNAAALGTVVQNTLNDQKIQTVTLINATVNSLQIIKSMNIGSSLRGAMIDSLRR